MKFMGSDVHTKLEKEPRTGAFGALSKQLLLGSVNRSLLTILTLALETQNAIDGGEQGIIGADTDIHTGMDVSAALANQNVAGLDELTISALGTQALGVGVTAVLGRAAALLVGEELKTNTNHDTDHPFLRV